MSFELGKLSRSWLEFRRLASSPASHRSNGKRKKRDAISQFGTSKLGLKGGRLTDKFVEKSETSFLDGSIGMELDKEMVVGRNNPWQWDISTKCSKGHCRQITSVVNNHTVVATHVTVFNVKVFTGNPNSSCDWSNNVPHAGIVACVGVWVAG